MAPNWQQVANFDDSLWELLKVLEAPQQSDRLNIHLVNGNWTIGVGFDLFAGGRAVRIGVYKGMGLNGDLLDPRNKLSPSDPLYAQTQVELDYLNQLEAAVATRNQTQLNVIMAHRAGDHRLNGYRDDRRATFTFRDDTEVRAVLDDLWPNVYREMIFNRYPTLQMDVASHPSREMLVLASLVWNGGPGLLGRRLEMAILDGNRAEAWYEIRYGSNGDDLPGIAKRRYYESEIFGLYDNPESASKDEAYSVYRMLTQHRQEIFKYEATYGENPDGSAGSRGDMINRANADYGLSILLPAAVDTLTQALTPAYEALFADLHAQYPTDMAGLSSGDFSPLNVYLDPNRDPGKSVVFLDGPNHSVFLNSAVDPVTGQEQNTRDILIGEGQDLLMGGGKDDVLIGDCGVWRMAA